MSSLESTARPAKQATSAVSVAETSVALGRRLPWRIAGQDSVLSLLFTYPVGVRNVGLGSALPSETA